MKKIACQNEKIGWYCDQSRLKIGLIKNYLFFLQLVFLLHLFQINLTTDKS